MKSLCPMLHPVTGSSTNVHLSPFSRYQRTKLENQKQLHSLLLQWIQKQILSPQQKHFRSTRGTLDRKRQTAKSTEKFGKVFEGRCWLNRSLQRIAQRNERSQAVRLAERQRDEPHKVSRKYQVLPHLQRLPLESIKSRLQQKPVGKALLQMIPNHNDLQTSI